MSLATNLTPAFGWVAQYSKNCFTSSSNFFVNFDWSNAMELIVYAIVGSTAPAYHAHVTTTSWMRLILAADMCGEFSFSSIWIFALY